MSGSEHDFLGDRRRALEDQFFAERDKQLLQKMKKELFALEDRKKLTHVSGIAEEQVLTDMMALGITAETLTAVGMIPLVETAWSDGSISAEERRAILRIADENGIAAGTAAHDILDQWLERRPDEGIFASWKHYVGALSKAMPGESFVQLRDTLLQRCRVVAGASGGFMGLGKISDREHDKIDDIIRALTEQD